MTTRYSKEKIEKEFDKEFGDLCLGILSDLKDRKSPVFVNNDLQVPRLKSFLFSILDQETQRSYEEGLKAVEGNERRRFYQMGYDEGYEDGKKAHIEPGAVIRAIDKHKKEAYEEGYAAALKEVKDRIEGGMIIQNSVTMFKSAIDLYNEGLVVGHTKALSDLAAWIDGLEEKK